MFLSRVTLNVAKLPPAMLHKWFSEQQPYASHQWLWQLFPEERERCYLFRQEKSVSSNGLFYLLSARKPNLEHNLFRVETKPFSPQLHQGMRLHFCLRANPVVTRNNKRSDVMMDAKFHARQQGIATDAWRQLQEQAAQRWLIEQGQRNGFCLLPIVDGLTNVVAYQPQRFVRRTGERPITFSAVDYAGYLTVTDPALFLDVLHSGLGKSKALGCGLLMIKRG